MKRESIVSLIIILSICNYTTAGIQQTGSVHQYIVRQAFNLFKHQIPGSEFSDIAQHIGDSEQGNSVWQTGLVVTGAYREDEEDPVYLYGGVHSWQVTMTHFWNADGGPNQTTLRFKNNNADQLPGNVVSEKEVHNYATPVITDYRDLGTEMDKMHLQFKGNLNDSGKSRSFYKMNIGITNNFLFSSDILNKSYSGFGITIEPYIVSYFAFKFKLNYWIIDSIDPNHFETPFNIASVLKQYYLLKLDIKLKNQLFFTQFGVLATTKKVGTEKRGGFNFGIGYRLYKYNNLNLCVIADRSILGQFGAHGNVWDKNSELSMEISYSVEWKN